MNKLEIYDAGHILTANDINAISSRVNELSDNKQDKLTTNDFKKINGQDIFGEGEISLSINIDERYDPDSENAQSGKAVAQALQSKQNQLIDGTSIKTINGTSILGSGNIEINNNESIVVDEKYSPSSSNAQSGKAVAQGIAQAIGNPYIEFFEYAEYEDGLQIINITNKEQLVGLCTIPDYYQGKPVRSIAKEVFQECPNLVEVIIPDTIVNIGSYQFCDCNSLTTIRIGKGITYLDTDLYSDSNNLSNLYLTSNTTQISSYTFSKSNMTINIYYDGTIGEWYNIDIVDDGASMATIMLSNDLKLHATQAFKVYSIDEFSSIDQSSIPEGTIIFIVDN